MRAITDKLYLGCRIGAGLMLVAILVLIVTQIVSRLMLVVIPGLDEFAAYCLAGATFLALAPTLRSGVHVRVTLLTQRLPPKPARVVEVTCYAIGLLLALYLAYASVNFVLASYARNEVAHGMVAVPLWIPRLSMPIGSVALCIAFLDGLILSARRREVALGQDEALRNAVSSAGH